jgi:hypothetical protein
VAEVKQGLPKAQHLSRQQPGVDFSRAAHVGSCVTAAALSCWPGPQCEDSSRCDLLDSSLESTCLEQLTLGAGEGGVVTVRCRWQKLRKSLLCVFSLKHSSPGGSSLGLTCLELLMLGAAWQLQHSRVGWQQGVTTGAGVTWGGSLESECLEQLTPGSGRQNHN